MRQLLSEHIVEGDRVEHVVVHPDAVPRPVLGFYVLSGDLTTAEEQVDCVCRRLLARASELRGWSLEHARVPLVPLAYESPRAFRSPPGDP